MANREEAEDDREAQLKQEKYNIETMFDKDGQPLFKVMQKHIEAKQTKKFGEQKKYEGILHLTQSLPQSS